MPSVSLIHEKLSLFFNLLPELDADLIEIAKDAPFLQVIIGTDINRVLDPEKVYSDIVLILEKYELKNEEIIKCISKYFNGDLWEKWNEGERELFINEVVKQKEEKEERDIERASYTDDLDKALDQVTGYKSGDFQKEIGERQQVKDIINLIYKVEIVTGITNKDPGYWRFYTSGHVFEIPATNLVKHNDFEMMYFTKFGNYLPSILTASKRGVKDTPWRMFLKTLRDRAVMVDPAESTELIEIGIIIDEIASEYRPTTDPVEWIKGSKTYLEVKEGYYLITPKKMKELAEDLHIKTELGKLSDIMSQRGMKKQGNPNKSVMGKKPRAWWFKKEFIDSQKNATPGDDEE